jgi:hypothetical protein
MTARRFGSLLVAALVVSMPSAILAQSSASYRLSEHAFNAAGRPAQGVVSTSTSYRLSLDSIGESIAGGALDGASYHLDGGIAATHRPPGEVTGLQILADQQTVTWAWEPASMTFNVYSGPVNTLAGGSGTCAAASVAGTTWPDTTAPASRSALFYLVAGENGLRQEGTLGYASSGAERGGAVSCP